MAKCAEERYVLNITLCINAKKKKRDERVAMLGVFSRGNYPRRITREKGDHAHTQNQAV